MRLTIILYLIALCSVELMRQFYALTQLLWASEILVSAGLIAGPFVCSRATEEWIDGKELPLRRIYVRLTNCKSYVAGKQHQMRIVGQYRQIFGDWRRKRFG